MVPTKQDILSGLFFSLCIVNGAVIKKLDPVGSTVRQYRTATVGTWWCRVSIKQLLLIFYGIGSVDGLYAFI